MSQNIGTDANTIHESSAQTSNEADLLSKEVKAFLDAMKRTDVKDTTLSHKQVNLKCSVSSNKSSNNGSISEISASHLCFSPALDYDLGTALDLNIETIDQTIQGRLAQREGGKCVIQLPLNDQHLSMMKSYIDKLLRIKF